MRNHAAGYSLILLPVFSPILFIMALSRKLALLHSFLLPYFAALISSANSLFSLRCIYFSLVAIPPLI